MNPPFPYFGGKRRAAAEVWQLLGRVSRYVEPFFGSGAVLLGSPHRPTSELVNDLDGYVANLWRALQVDPATVERLASAPCDERELKARHLWLFSGEGAERLRAVDWNDLRACDAEVAGVWLWAASVAIKIGSQDLCRSAGPRGVKSMGVDLDAITERVSRVQVLCGDWSRCVTPTALGLPQAGNAPTGIVGVFLDPPYGDGRSVGYEDGTGDAADAAWRWAVDNGNNPRLRIVVAGYDDGRDLPDGWTVTERSEKGGYGNASGNENRHRERLWASPHCVRPQQDLFAAGAHP